MPNIDVHIGDCREVMAAMTPASIDAIVCDPPYNLGIIGETWDTWDSPAEYQQWCEQWAAAALEIAKPGCFLIAFCATRTVHRLVSGIEDAGWTIRDQGVWLYRSGHPKNRDAGWLIDKNLGVDDKRKVVGTKRLPDTTKSSAGFAALTAEGGKSIMRDVPITEPYSPLAKTYDGWAAPLKPAIEPWVLARKPLDGTLPENLMKHGTGALNIPGCRIAADDKPTFPDGDYRTDTILGDVRPEQRQSDRNPDTRYPANVVTLDDDEQFRHFKIEGIAVADYKKASQAERPGEKTDQHYTVKPIDLMRWLVRLVTPSGGVVLDPFSGSGTTLEAAYIEGFDAVGIEINERFKEIIEARIHRPRQMSLGI